MARRRRRKMGNVNAVYYLLDTLFMILSDLRNVGTTAMLEGIREHISVLSDQVNAELQRRRREEGKDVTRSARQTARARYKQQELFTGADQHGSADSDLQCGGEPL